jgi:hypothetical protein
VQKVRLSNAHTIPFALPVAETEGVLPGNPKVPGDADVALVLNFAVVVFSW